MELIRCDSRLIVLSEPAYRLNYLAYLVMLLDGRPDCSVGGVDTVLFRKRSENVVLALNLHKLNAVIVGLERYLHIFIKELAVAAVHGVQQLHILAAAIHHRAAVGRNEAIGKVISALYLPFE